MYLDVLVELTNVFIDKTFTYRNNLGKKIDIGTRVKVPFGTRELEGFVLNVKETLDEKIENIKDVISVVDDFPVLNKELLYLGKYISKTTLSSLMSSYSCMLPKALKAKIDVKINIKYDTYIKLNEEKDLKKEKLNDSQIKIVDYLKKNKEVLKEELNIFSQSSINTLIKRGILLKEEKEHYRYNLTKSAKEGGNAVGKSAKSIIKTEGPSVIDPQTGVVLEGDTKPLPPPTPKIEKPKSEDLLDPDSLLDDVEDIRRRRKPKNKPTTQEVPPRLKWGIFEGASMPTNEIIEYIKSGYKIESEEQWNNLSNEEKERILKCTGVF